MVVLRLVDIRIHALRLVDIFRKLLGSLDDRVVVLGKLFDQILLCAGRSLDAEFLLGECRLCQIVDVIHQRRCELLLYHINECECFDMKGLRVILDPYLISGLKLRLGIDMMLRKHLDVLVRDKCRHRIGCGFEIVKASLLRFLDPLICISVTVEDDPLMLCDRLLDELLDCLVHLLGFYILKHFVEA